MNLFFKRLFEPRSNSPEITKLLLQELNVPVTATTIAKELEEHPNYNSLLSISDVLNRFGVENLAARFEGDKLFALPTPFIVQLRGINGGADNFTIVKKAEGDSVFYFNPTAHKWNYSNRNNFLTLYKGVVLLTEAGESSGEKDFVKNLKVERRKRRQSIFTMLFIPLLLCVAGGMSILQYGVSILPSVIYGLLSLVGASIGFLLLWYELDQHNPALQQICSAGKKINCGAVLQSGAAKIAGISWSVIGFTYFMGSLLLLLFAGFNNPQVLFVLSSFTLLASPYVFFSIYYQWRVAKQWCVLCLCVQVLLVLQLVTVLASGWSININTELIPAIFLAYGLPFILSTMLLPVFKKAKESKDNINLLQRLKHNSQIFDALLSKQKQIIASTVGLGITLGNPDAPHKIIKVCNPYCGPCAKAHAPMEALLENNPNVQVQIIFTARNIDESATPAKHLLAIAAQNIDNEDAVKKGLDDWYLSTSKSYEQFAAKYPMNGELIQQEHKIDAMSQWCHETGISFTPTFFVNGYQLPDIYTVEDLKYFLTI
jgi:uncharacterized membrane protein